MNFKGTSFYDLFFALPNPETHYRCVFELRTCKFRDHPLELSALVVNFHDDRATVLIIHRRCQPNRILDAEVLREELIFIDPCLYALFDKEDLRRDRVEACVFSVSLCSKETYK